MRFTPSAQDWRTAFWILVTSSGMIFVAVISHFEAPREVNTFWRVGMHLSVDGSAEAVSEIIIMEAVSFCWSAIVAWDCLVGLMGGWLMG